MKSRILVTACIFASLVFVAFAAQAAAQQSNSNASAQSANSSPSTDATLPPLPPPTSNDFWDGDSPNFVNLITHPFARKSYVKRLTQPIHDRLQELDQLTAANSQAIKDTDARSQTGLQLASEKISLADTHASDAASKAQVASSASTEVTNRVSRAEQMVAGLDQYKSGSQTEILFGPGQTLLSKKAKDALDQMVTPLKNQNNYVIEVRGFAPGHGQAAIATSREMADSVVRYLVLSQDIPMFRIFVEGMGNATVAGDGGTTKHVSPRRVEVSLLQNETLSAQH
jgi:outer membrane protein OmpA-like peptidoglycan-associated protein